MDDVNLFAGLGYRSPTPGIKPAPEPAPRTPLPEDVESWEGPRGIRPKGRWARCREPGGCDEASIATTLRCVEHLRPENLLDYADCYAVASILYYSGAEVEFMRDANFDGICSALLQAQAWRVVPWLEEGMLKAGSGYDLTKFPPELHEAAREWLESR